MMTAIFGLVDLGVYVLFDKGPKDPLVDDTIGSLEQMSIQFGQSIEYVNRSPIPPLFTQPFTGVSNQTSEQFKTR